MKRTYSVAKTNSTQTTTDGTRMTLYACRLAILLLLCIPLQAQKAMRDTLLTREVVLEKEYNPTIRDASRLNTLPEVTDPVVSKTTVNYANYALPFDVSPQLSPLKANEYFTNVKESAKRGYAVAAIATNMNLNGDLGYLLQKENTRLALFYSHHSANGKVSYLQDDTRQRMKLNDNLGGLHLDQTFDPFILSARLKYTDSRFNYYGYTAPYLGFPVLTRPIDKTINQENSLLNVDLGLISKDEQDINYRFNLNVASFEQKYSLLMSVRGPREIFINADWDVNTAFGDMPVGIAGYFRSVSYSDVYVNDPTLSSNFEGYDNYGQLSMNPYASYDGGNWKIRIGAKVHYYAGHSSLFSLAPDVALSIALVPGSDIYLTADGGITTHTNQSLYYENRYLSPFFRVADSKTLLDAVLGFKSTIQGVCWLDVYGGYKITGNEHFFISGYPKFNGNVGNTLLSGNSITAEIRDANLFKIGLKAKYQFQNIIETSLKVQYNIWNVEGYTPGVGNSKAWNKPLLESDLNAAYMFPDFPLRLDLTYHLEAGREALWNGEVKKMKNIHDLNLKATHSINDTFSVFAQTNNVLWQHYDLWYGYPAQGVSVLIGGSIKF